MNEKLRNEVKLIKIYQGVSYKELAEYLDIRQDSFYSWLKGRYNLGEQKQHALKEILDTIKE